MIVKWRIKILQQRMLGILLAQDSLFRRNTPVNTQRIIQNADASVRFRITSLKMRGSIIITPSIVVLITSV
jgi:hypothetical protein